MSSICGCFGGVRSCALFARSACAVCVCVRARASRGGTIFSSKPPPLSGNALAPSRETRRRLSTTRSDTTERTGGVYLIHARAPMNREGIAFDKMCLRALEFVCVVSKATLSKICEAKERALFVTFCFRARRQYDVLIPRRFYVLLHTFPSTFCSVSSGILCTRIPTPHTRYR